ncbi:hypothetical protein IHC92_20715 [Photobacterium damselae subsp. damselae]|uniref:hypothetical protein n=1 Tax=Photobacterium damselae TaxID=38293 RepID=UPI001F2726F1|nr:hypothetical protein [Photobacterium damselae]UKA23377.1 hypothetical protein IHC92_20715 [Photobacterium damselae subsp. damselae]
MNPLLQLILASLQNQQPQQNNMLSLLGGTQQQTPEQQLLALLAGNQPQQNNPLQSLFNMNHQQPQGGDINQQLLSLLLNQQKPQQTPEQQLLAMLQGNNQQQQSNTGGLDLEVLQKLLQGNNSGDGKDKEKSIIDILKDAQKTTETEKDKEQNLEKLVQLKSDLKKFVDDNEDRFPDYFDFDATMKEVEKWADGVDQITQGWTAAISKAFFDVEANRDALEERDRNLIEKGITKAADRAVDRDQAWDLISRSAFNLKRMADNGAVPTKGNDKVIDAYGARFDLGQKVAEQQSKES